MKNTVEIDKEQFDRCHERVGLTNPSPLKCPCDGCGGALVADGTNRLGTIRFVMCLRCACTHTIAHEETLK